MTITFAQAAQNAARQLSKELERMRLVANRPKRPRRVSDVFPTILQLAPYHDDPGQDGIAPESS